SPQVREIYGPEAEQLSMAWRFPGANSHDADLLAMTDMVLANRTAGLIDLNLNQQQKLLHAETYAMPMTDYSVHYFGGNPKEGQSLDQVRDLILSQIELVKKVSSTTRFFR